MTPTIDTFRYDDVWNTDLRVARTFKLRAMSFRLIGDLFNVMNANTALVRNNNVLSTERVQRRSRRTSARGSSGPASSSGSSEILIRGAASLQIAAA